MNPMVSVLMPVFNGEKYLSEAIGSILNQTFTDFEFLIIDDGSTDRSIEIAKSYSDPRIKILLNDANYGIVKALNRGLKLSKGKYIARMDADDISIPSRFQKQYDFMEKNQDIGICGTWIELFGTKSEVWSPPITHNEIFVGMLFESMIYHPTVFIRRELIVSLKQFYNEAFQAAQDYDFWVRLSLNGIKFANIGEVLLKYRIHANNISKLYSQIRMESAYAVIDLFLQKLNISYSDIEFKSHIILRNGKIVCKAELKEIKLWLNKLIQANEVIKLFPKESFANELSMRWFRVCYNSYIIGLYSFFYYQNNKISTKSNLSIKKNIIFFIKCWSAMISNLFESMQVVMYKISKRIRRSKQFISSNSYWKQRYRSGGNSGKGSYGQLAEFKADVLNKFILENGVKDVIEFGCGDGNQLLLANYPNYIGFDISNEAINICKKLFSDDTNKRFSLMNRFSNERADLVLSLDVIYHLIEDTVYFDYMHKLFNSSKKYVIIYSSNTDDNFSNPALHVKHRKFSNWIDENHSNWHLKKIIPNKYPLKSRIDGSFADFYIYEKI